MCAALLEMKIMLKKIGLKIAALSCLLMAGAAMADGTGAAAIDVTGFTGTLSNQETSVVTVVGASFLLLGIVVGVKYIRRAAK